MNTRNFNQLDILIARWRLSQVLRWIPAQAQLLDFGCGTQAFLLKALVGRIEYGYGIDYDATPSKTKHYQIINTTVTNRLPFPPKMFGVVTLLAVLEHMTPSQARQLFKEFHRVLQPGGRVVLTTPTPASQWLLELLAFRVKIISYAEIADHKHYYSQQDIAKLAQKAGFRLVTYSTFQAGLNSLAVLEK